MRLLVFNEAALANYKLGIGLGNGLLYKPWAGLGCFFLAFFAFFYCSLLRVSNAFAISLNKLSEDEWCLGLFILCYISMLVSSCSYIFTIQSSSSF